MGKTSIRYKFNSITVITIAISLIFSGLIIAHFQRQMIYRIFEDILSARVRITGFNCQAPLVFNDVKSAEETLRAYRTDGTVLAACLYDNAGKMFAFYRNPQYSEPFPDSAPAIEGFIHENEKLSIVGRIFMETKESIGTVVIICDLYEMNKTIHTLFGIIFFIIGISSVLALFIASGLQNEILTRIRTLASNVDLVAKGTSYDQKISNPGEDEIGLLIEGFNKMVDELQKRDHEVNAKRNELAQLNAQLEHKVIERTRELKESNKQLEAFSYSVAHDLRAPLRHIDGFADMLSRHLSSTIDEKGQRYITTIGKSAKELGLLIDHLLVFSRIGKAAFVYTKINMSQIVQEIRDNLNETAKNRNIEWHIETLPEVEADLSMIKLVIENLLSNAVKYTQNVPKTIIEITCRSTEEDFWEFMVSDNGAGFDMKYVNKLFGVFQRLHAASDFEGTGIGLANVRRIISRHGGQTWAEGAINQGAKFFFTLPRTKNEQI